jgi:hypothetical protein
MKKISIIIILLLSIPSITYSQQSGESKMSGALNSAMEKETLATSLVDQFNKLGEDHDNCVDLANTDADLKNCLLKTKGNLQTMATTIDQYVEIYDKPTNVADSSSSPSWEFSVDIPNGYADLFSKEEALKMKASLDSVIKTTDTLILKMETEAYKNWITQLNNWMTAFVKTFED